MKLQHFFFVLCISLAACTNDDEVVDFASTFKSEQSGQSIRSLDEAIQIAQSAACMVKGNTTRLSIDRSVDLGDIHVVKNLITRNATEGFNSDTLMYVINYTDGGFAVVSANPDVEGLLAVTEEGHYTGEAESGVEGFDDFMMLAKLYSSASREGDRAQNPHSHKDTLDIQHGPFLEVKWGQRNYPGMYCPNGVSGCVPLAIAQIFSFFKHPASISLTYPERDADSLTLNWNDICKHKLFYEVNGLESSLYCSASTTAHVALGKLCRQIGYALNSIYYSYTDPSLNKTGTPTNTADFVDAIEQFGYGCTANLNYTVGTAREMIDLFNRPFMMAGQRLINNEDSTYSLATHAWVVDGYMDRVITTIDTAYYVPELIPPGSLPYVISITESHRYYTHINWGWNGRNNGYYVEDVFATNRYIQLDSNPYTPIDSIHNYHYNIKYFDIDVDVP